MVLGLNKSLFYGTNSYFGTDDRISAFVTYAHKLVSEKSGGWIRIEGRGRFTGIVGELICSLYITAEQLIGN